MDEAAASMRRFSLIGFHLWRETSRRREFVRGPLRMHREQWHRLRNRLHQQAPQGTRYVARNLDQDGEQLRLV